MYLLILWYWILKGWFSSGRQMCFVFIGGQLGWRSFNKMSQEIPKGLLKPLQPVVSHTFRAWARAERLQLGRAHAGFLGAKLADGTWWFGWRNPSLRWIYLESRVDEIDPNTNQTFTDRQIYQSHGSVMGMSKSTFTHQVPTTALEQKVPTSLSQLWLSTNRSADTPRPESVGTMWISIKSGTVDGIQKSSKLTSWGRLVVYPNNLHAFTTIPGGYSGHKCDPFPSARKLPWMIFFHTKSTIFQCSNQIYCIWHLETAMSRAWMINSRTPDGSPHLVPLKFSRT